MCNENYKQIRLETKIFGAQKLAISQNQNEAMGQFLWHFQHDWDWRHLKVQKECRCSRSYNIIKGCNF